MSTKGSASYQRTWLCHASTLAEVTAQSDIVLTVVTNDAMESIFFSADDNLFQAASQPFSLIVPPSAMHVKLETAAVENGSTTLGLHGLQY